MSFWALTTDAVARILHSNCLAISSSLRFVFAQRSLCLTNPALSGIVATMNENEPAGRPVPMGTHLVHIEGDTLMVTARDMITVDDMRQLLEHFIRIKREHGMLFVFYDGLQCTGIDAGARKIASQMRTEDSNANLRVAFGIPFTIRVLLSMIVRAQKVLANRDVNVQVFEHEKEARAYFEKERDRLRRELSAKKSL